MVETELESYPRTMSFGGVRIRLRPMVAADRDAILQFAHSLDSHDLLFLDRDITSGDEVDRWMAEVAAGDVITILARDGDEIVGYASLERSRLRWTQHVAEIRLLVSGPMRRHGLGRQLTREVFALAHQGGVEKIVAHMTVDQGGAIAVFAAFGFQNEGVFADHARDRDGSKHHVVTMSLEVVGEPVLRSSSVAAELAFEVTPEVSDLQVAVPLNAAQVPRPLQLLRRV